LAVAMLGHVARREGVLPVLIFRGCGQLRCARGWDHGRGHRHELRECRDTGHHR
jgi:hypothetical protein